MIDFSPKVFISVSSNPGRFGEIVHNAGYKYHKLNYIYILLNWILEARKEKQDYRYYDHIIIMCCQFMYVSCCAILYLIKLLTKIFHSFSNNKSLIK